MIEYLIFPKKADEAPIPLSKITVPFLFYIGGNNEMTGKE